MKRQKKNKIIVFAILITLFAIFVLMYLSNNDNKSNDNYSNQSEIIKQESYFKEADIIYQRELFMSDENKAIFNERLVVAEHNLENADDKFSAYNSVGLIKKDLGDFLGAIESFKRAADYDEDNFVAWLNIGNTYKEMHDYSNAETAYKKSHELAPTTDNSYLALMDLYWYNSNLSHKQLLEIFNEYFSKSKSHSIALKIGQYLESEGYIKEAISFWEKYLEKNPGNNEVEEILRRLKDL